MYWKLACSSLGRDASRCGESSVIVEPGGQKVSICEVMSGIVSSKLSTSRYLLAYLPTYLLASFLTYLLAR